MFRSEISHMLKNYKILQDENHKKKLYNDLLAAVREDKASEVKTLLDIRASINIKDEQGHTLLAIAAEKGNIATAKVLLKHSPALMNTQNNDGLTPLAIAENKGQAKFAEFLLESSINSELLSTILVGDTTKVKKILAQNISTDIRDINGRNLLAIAADKGHDEIVKLLLEQHPELLKASSADGLTPLFLAAGKGHTKVVALLAEQKSVDVNECVNGFAPIYMAAAKGYSSIVSCLLEHKANPDQTYEHKQTILSAAISSGNIATVEALLAHKAGVNNPDADGMTPFEIAVHYQNVDMCKLLLKYKAKVDVNKNDLLFKAVSNNALLALLLAQRVNINKPAEKSYKTTFFSEVEQGSTPLLAAIHAKEKTSMGDTAKLAVCDASIRMIMDNKPDVTIPDKTGFDPLQYAISIKDTTLARALLEQKANVNSHSEKVFSPLITAAIRNDAAMVKLLIEYKADLELTSPDGAGPLTHAVINCGYETVITLLEHKVNINTINAQGFTPLDYAIRNHRKNMISINSHKPLTIEDYFDNLLKDNKDAENTQKIREALEPSTKELLNRMERINQSIASITTMNGNKIIKTLIEYKASAGNKSPLTLMVEAQLDDTLKAVLESKSDIDVNMPSPENGFTALHEAAILGNVTACQLLLDHKADVNMLDKAGMTPLFYAVSKNRENVVITLLEHGANFSNQEKFSMVDAAEKLGNQNILNMLNEMQPSSGGLSARSR